MSRMLRYVTPLIPAFVVIGFFVWFANWIPQTRWQPPQAQEISAALTSAELAQVGQTIVRQRGCLACHTLEPGAGVKGGGRGPNLSGIAARRAQVVKGGPDNLVDYLAQALYEPGAYLVEGYANIMPPSNGAPAALSYEEVVAVIITAITLIFFVLLALAFSISGLARGPASESGGDTHSPEALTHGGRA